MQGSIERLGIQTSASDSPLVYDMNNFSIGNVMVSCVFNVVCILLITISCMLIYSLLMVSTEQRTFDNGVLRMVGVTKLDCILVVAM